MKRYEGARFYVLEAPGASCPLCDIPAPECSHYAFIEERFAARYLVFIDTIESE